MLNGAISCARLSDIPSTTRVVDQHIDSAKLFHVPFLSLLISIQILNPVLMVSPHKYIYFNHDPGGNNYTK
jgi:hypothetical protein